MKITHLFLFIFLIFAGCQSPTLDIAIKNVKTPPPFSFLEKTPQNKTFEHIARMRRYDKILESSPIPVFVISQEELPQNLFIISDRENKFYGIYVEKSPDDSWPSKFIFLNKNESANQIMTTYFHEYGHYKCEMSKCVCYVDNMGFGKSKILSIILKEKHAMINELEMSWEMSDTYLLSRSIITIANYALNNNSGLYQMAAIAATEEDIWKKIMNYLKEIKEEK